MHVELLRGSFQRWGDYMSLFSCSGGPGVDKLASMMNDTLDQTLTLEMLNGNTCKTPVDFHAVDQNGLRDHLVGWDFLEDFVERRLVTDDVVVRFVSDFSLRPFFLLGGLVA